MTRFESFYNQTVGFAWDKYGNKNFSGYAQGSDPFGGQCVSLIKTYLYYLFGHGKVKDSYGDAKDYWNNRNSNGILDLCTVVNDLKNGDIVISEGSDARYGHIFIYKDGQAFTQNCANNPKATIYPLNWQGRVVGILRPKIKTENFELIPEHRIAVVKDGPINVRVDNPVGRVVRSANNGDRIEYTEKCVCYGHRYISWIESDKRHYMAVTPTQEQKDHWIDILPVPVKKTELRGVDISNYQPDFDFNKAKSQIDFAIFRCAWGTNTDASFFRHVREAKKHGVQVPAVYVFSYALNKEQALSEADYAVKLVKEAGLPKSTIIFFDPEYDTINYANKNKVTLTGKDIQEFTRLFMDRVAASGYKTGYYANLDWSRNYFKGFNLKKGEYFWYARYGNVIPEYDYDFLQYTSKGKLNGIGYNLDMNIWKTDHVQKAVEVKKEVWDRNAVVNVGDTVRSCSCHIAVVPGTNSAFKDDCVYIPALGGLVPLKDITEASDTEDGSNDNVITTLASKVYLDPTKVTAVNSKLNLVQVNGYWVNAEPLEVKK